MFFSSSCAEVNGYWHIKLKYIINDQTWFGKGWWPYPIKNYMVTLLSRLFPVQNSSEIQQSQNLIVSSHWKTPTSLGQGHIWKIVYKIRILTYWFTWAQLTTEPANSCFIAITFFPVNLITSKANLESKGLFWFIWKRTWRLNLLIQMFNESD